MEEDVHRAMSDSAFELKGLLLECRAHDFQLAGFLEHPHLIYVNARHKDVALSTNREINRHARSRARCLIVALARRCMPTSSPLPLANFCCVTGHRACALGSKDCLPPTRRFECSHHPRLLGCRSIFLRQARILASLHHDVPDLAIEFATSPSFQSTFQRTFQPTALPDSPLTKQPFTVRFATAARACYPDPHPDITCFSNLSVHVLSPKGPHIVCSPLTNGN